MIRTILMFIGFSTVLNSSPLVVDVKDLETLKSLGITVSLNKPEHTYRTEEEEVTVVWDVPDEFRRLDKTLGGDSIGISLSIFRKNDNGEVGSIVYTSALQVVNNKNKALRFFYNTSSLTKCNLYFGEPGSFLLRLDLKDFLNGLPEVRDKETPDWKLKFKKVFPLAPDLNKNTKRAQQ